MIATREHVLNFWRDVDRGRREYKPVPHGCIDLNAMPFPDFRCMAPEEKKEFARLVGRNPSWLFKIVVFAEHSKRGPIIQ